MKLVLAEKETDEEGKKNPVKCLVTNKIDAPTEHIIRSYGMRWRIETFFEDSKQDLGLGDCEIQTDEGVSVNGLEDL
jgi:SRSO17 transposase